MKLRLHARFLLFAVVALVTLLHSIAQCAETYIPFQGEKSAWHDGFDRFDFVMDESSLTIKPFKAPSDEELAVKDPAKGQRRCVVVVPKKAAPGNPWSWRGCYWN